MRANTSKTLDAFSDFPPAESLPMFPRVEELRDYLRSYAQAFDLNRSIRLKTPVRRVEREHRGRLWREIQREAPVIAEAVEQAPVSVPRGGFTVLATANSIDLRGTVPLTGGVGGGGTLVVQSDGDVGIAGIVVDGTVLVGDIRQARNREQTRPEAHSDHLHR